MLNELLIWVALAVGLVFLAIDRRRGIGALTLAYFLALSLGHIPGLLSYLDSEIAREGFEATKVGIDVTLIGITVFIVGAIAARILPQSTASVEGYQQGFGEVDFWRLGWRILAAGVIAQFVFLPVSALLPSLTAITASFGTLLVLGFWVLLYSSAIANDGQQTVQTVGIFMMLPLLPLGTLVTGGFIGFGTVWALSIVAFYFVVARRRIWFYLLMPPVIFMGLSLFVTYFQQRGDMRDVIWYQDAGITGRLNQVSKLVTEFQLLDLSNEKHLWALDERLNQNSLLGMGVMRHRAGLNELWYGATVPIWAVIPRAIWPDKPSVGGSGDLVTEFTGITFQEGTSVGAGQVLEFYMNFGMAGVLVGFASFGFMLMRLDQALMRALATGNIHGVVQHALPGLALLQPLGSLLEMLVATISAIVVAQLLIRSGLLVLPFIKRPNVKRSGPTTRMIVRR
jgi:hypothetical protein